MEPIESPRLHLRLLDAGDEGLYLALYTDPVVMAHIGPPMEPHAARRAFRAACSGNASREAPAGAWVVAPRAGGPGLGLLVLRRGRGAGRTGAGSLELGVMLLPAARGRGIGRELNAVALALAFRGDAAVDRVIARHAVTNQAAAAALAASGFAAAGRDGALALREVSRSTWEAGRHVGACAT